MVLLWLPSAEDVFFMPCYHPLKAFRTPSGVVFQELNRHDIIGDIELPCGQCIGCRMRRASDWTLRVQHEASLWPRNCFVTLTYARDCLPPDGSLFHRDFQLFMKRLRKFVGCRVRFYMCGEYGENSLRPHYHACLFNVDFQSDRVHAGKSASGSRMYASKTLEVLWGHGMCTVQDLVRETAGYCARYIMKKQLGDPNAYATADGVVLKPEYSVMSKGVGRGWLEKYKRDVFPHDFVVAEGGRHRVPRYYDRVVDLEAEEADRIEYERYLAGKACAADNTDERRAVREVVHLAQVRSLKRGLE